MESEHASPPVQGNAARVPLTVSVEFNSQELMGLDVPIEIRRPNGVLVARTLCSKPVNVAPGRYFVSAVLPGGQKLLDTVVVGDEPVSITLRPDAADLSPHEWEEVAHYLGPRKRTTATTAAATQTPASPTDRVKLADVSSLLPRPAFLRLFRGNALSGRLMPVNPAQLAPRNWEQGRIVEFYIDGSGLIVQLLVPGAEPRNMVVPSAGGFPASIVLTRDADCGYKMEAHVNHREAELLLRYAAQDAAQLAEITLESGALSAERLLYDKERNPIAAAIGAYALLRQSDITRLHDWTQYLCDRFPWLPDGAAIRGEHLARNGRHAEAVVHFAKLCDRGLPILADGLFYACERLRWYAGLLPDARQDIDITLARRVLQPMRAFANWAHRRRPILSFPGLNPAAPGADVLSVEAAPAEVTMAAGALDLSRWLSPLPAMPSGWPARFAAMAGDQSEQKGEGWIGA